MFWETAGESLRTQIIERICSIRDQQQDADSRKQLVLEDARTACAPDSFDVVNLVAQHLGALDNDWRDCRDDPYE